MKYVVHYDSGFRDHRALCGTDAPLYTTSNIRNVTCKRCKKKLEKLAGIKRRRPSY